MSEFARVRTQLRIRGHGAIGPLRLEHDTAHALYDAVGSDGPWSADQYLRMGQATSVRGFYNVEAKWLAIPTFNLVAADDHGNAYYGDVGATPAVSQAEINTCTPPACRSSCSQRRGW